MNFKEMATVLFRIRQSFALAWMRFCFRALHGHRATAGIRGKTLIINLPGSPKAVKESLEYIIDALGHGIEILTGEAGNCARK